ncbi:MAG: T9SS type A sorting domain-containing protein [Saprospiraceae bacterium]
MLQNSLSRTETIDEDIIFLNYKLVNEGVEALNNLFAGIIIDFDIGEYLNNFINTDKDINLIYQFNGDIYAGIKLLNTDYSNTNLIGIKSVIDRFSEDVKYNYLSGNSNDLVTNVKDDWSCLLSIGSSNLLSQDTLDLNFALVVGTSLEDLKSNAKKAQDYFDDNLVAVYDLENELDDIEVFPNPSSGEFTILSNTVDLSGCQINLFDITGKMINTYNNIKDVDQLSIQSDLESGIYLLNIVNSDINFTCKLIIDK